MSGELKADYQTGETQVIMPTDFIDQPRHIQQAFLKGWIQNLIDQLNAAAEHEVAPEQDEPLPYVDKVAAAKAEEKLNAVEDHPND
jgi:hypothetical protein